MTEINGRGVLSVGDCTVRVGLVGRERLPDGSPGTVGVECCAIQDDVTSLAVKVIWREWMAELVRW